MIQHQLSIENRAREESNMLSSTRPKKRQKVTGRETPVVKVRFQEKHGTPKCIELHALLDSGCSGTLMNKKFAKKLRTRKDTTTNWGTANGVFETSRRCKINMQLPELSNSMTVNVDTHLVKKISERYDMIIGRDVMSELGITLDFKDKLVLYEHIQLPMIDIDNVPARGGRFINELHYATGIEEPPLAAEAVNRVSQILDAKYAPVTPEQIIDNSPHLTEEQKRSLKPILYKHIKLFDGTLGKWKGIQHQLELKDPKSKPFACRPYPVPVKNKATLMLEINRLCKIGVLRKVNNSEYQSPSTIIPKKDNTVRFITDFRKLNERIKRKPFPLPNIRDTLLELKGFEYGTSLDLNMGYYHIELHPDSRKYCTIVFPFGKYEYLRLPMGLCNSPDIFQEHIS